MFCGWLLFGVFVLLLPLLFGGWLELLFGVLPFGFMMAASTVVMVGRVAVAVRAATRARPQYQKAAMRMRVSAQS